MGSDYVQPEYRVEAFNCPHCGAFAHQEWYPYVESSDGKKVLNMSDFDVSCCARCKKVIL